MRTPLRDLLPVRRRCETFNITFGGQNTAFTVTLGYYQDGRIGEVFIDGAKAGSELAAIARDGAILVSLSLQHGVPMETIQGALSRDERNRATSIVGVVVDEIVRRGNG